MRWLLGLTLLFAQAALAESYITFPSDIDWVTRDTAHFKILYRRGSDAPALRTLAAAERAHALLAPIFGETPPVTWIVLADFQDALNGYAIDYPMPHFVVFLSPPESSGQLAALDQWLDSVVLHEYTHVLHLYPAHGAWSFLRTLFGAWILPNGLMPSHLHEGLATFMETELTKGGRGRSPGFKATTRMAVKEDAWGKDFVPLDLLEGSATRWPQGMAPYYFGYYLYEELWRRKKAEGIGAFVQKTSRAWPYLIQEPITEVYGEDYPSLWRAVFEKQRAIAKEEIAQKERTPLSQVRHLTQTRFTKWDLSLSPDGKQLAYRQNHPDTGNRLFLQPTDLKEATSFEFDPGHPEGLCWLSVGGKQTLVFSETDSADGYSKNVLRFYDAEEKKRSTPTVDNKAIDHVHAVGCAAQGRRLLTYQESAYEGWVREWASEDGTRWQSTREWKLQPGDWVTSLFFQEPGFAIRRAGNTLVYRWTKTEPELVLTLPGHFHRIATTDRAGEYLAIGAFDGTDEVFRIQTQDRSYRRVISVLGGVGAFATDGNRWWTLDYRHGGYDLAESVPVIAPKRPLPPASPAAEPLPTIAVSDAKDYSARSTMLPTGWMPSMLIVPAGIQFSAWIPGFDVSQKHVYSLFGGYDTRGSPFVMLDYTYRFGLTRQLAMSFDYVPSYIISSSAFFRQWGGSIAYSARLAKNWPRVSIGINTRRLEPTGSITEKTSIGLTLSLSHSFWVRTTPRGIAPTRATQLSFSYSRYFTELGSTDQFYVMSAGLDQYVGMPWWRHVLKLGVKFGTTEGTSKYNSWFQGGGELVFSAGRGFFLNRGFYPGTFFTPRMMTFNFDYMFPLVEVERGPGQWPFFLKRIDGALTADATTIGIANFNRYYYGSVGFELKSYWKMFYYFPVQMRIGAYHGFGRFGVPLYITTAVEASI
ncbi:hypothetical protein K2X33_14165 [bacterium]|nr:hypothetical protein [bacterium]